MSESPTVASPEKAGSDAGAGSEQPFPGGHLLGLKGLGRQSIIRVLDLANSYADSDHREARFAGRLRGRTLVNLFYENSTRTLASFELAGKRLGMDVVNLGVSTSSVQKGETLSDTARTLDAMGADAIVIRHSEKDAPREISGQVRAAVINAGDGSNEHPTQALLDALTMRRAKGGLEGLSVAICGDLAHSRVARSNFHLLGTMGAKVRAVAPTAFLPADIGDFDLNHFEDMDEGIAGVDVVMMLRVQKERLGGAGLPADYIDNYGLTMARLQRAAPDAVVMHPGPMNRGVEIASDVADHPTRSLIFTQVKMGVAVRMAVLDLCCGSADD